MKALVFVSLALTSAVTMTGQVAAPPAKGVEALVPAASRVAAPDFTLTDVQGKTITLSKYKGQVVLLDFWATTCGG